MSGISLSVVGLYIHYVALSKGIEEQWGKLDLNATMSVLCYVYTGKTDARFFIFQTFHRYSTPYQWVLCPETGDFLLSFASHDMNAFESTDHEFNLFDLLDATPP